MGMALYAGMLNNTCTIFRLSSSFDVDSSEFGEIAESWGIVSSSVLCRLDVGSVPIRQIRGGLSEEGMRMLFVEEATDLRKNDRVLVDSEYYQVKDVKNIPGYSTYHHKEAPVELIDWEALGDPTIWEQEDIGTGTTVNVEAGRGMDVTTVSAVTTVKSEFDIKEFAFTYETASISNIASVVADERVKRITVQITTTFDDASTTITVGDGGDNDRLMAADENMPGTVGIYEVAPNYLYASASVIRLYINAGTSSQGQGILYVETELND